MTKPTAMPANRSMPEAVIMPELAYVDVAAAAEWLCACFGFTERLRIGTHRVQLVLGAGAMVVIERPPGESSRPGLTHAVMVRVGDVNQHHARAVRRGVRILRPPADYPYGERQYTAEDLGGHVWTFSQTIKDADPASWGGTVPR